VHVAKGYSSTTIDKKAAERYGNGKGWTLLYIGDFDPTGVDIDRKLQDELRFYGSRPKIERIALTLEQAQALPIETQERVKVGESRGPAYMRKYGLQVSWEIEALPAHQLRDTLRQAVADNGYDFEALKQARAIETRTDEMIEEMLQDVFADLNERVLTKGLPDLDVPLDVQRLYLDAAAGNGKENGDAEDCQCS
jgi:hypothetical protein